LWALFLAHNTHKHTLSLTHARARTHSKDAAEVATAAEELFKMTSFTSAVAIDTPEALTDYDRAVFGAGAGIYACVYVHTCICTCLLSRRYRLYMCVCMYVCMHACIYAHARMDGWMHTCTHKRPRTRTHTNRVVMIFLMYSHAPRSSVHMLYSLYIYILLIYTHTYSSSIFNFSI
jgi:hypothetical protein